MNQAVVLELVRSILTTALTIAMPILLVGMTVGVLVSLFQAITSVHEQTLALIPKMLAVVATTLFLLPWILNVLIGYTRPLLQNLPSFAR